MRRTLILALVALLAPGCDRGKGSGTGAGQSPPPAAERPRLVVIGVDGLDPGRLASLAESGRLPNLERLHRASLATTSPSDPSTAWASLLTGTQPAAHGVPGDAPLHPSRNEILGGPWVLAGDGGSVTSLRRGEPFWVTASRAGVRVRVVGAPCSFPPDPVASGEVLAGGDVPGLLGSHGGFQLIQRGAAPGAVHAIDGPVLDGEPTRAEISIDLESQAGWKASAAVGHGSVAIEPHAWSGFLPVVFEGGAGSRLHGLTRLMAPPRAASALAYAESPHMDPFAPRFPVSHPRYYAGFLADRYGRYRLSWDGADAEAFDSGAIDTSDYLKQMWGAIEAQERMVIGEMGRGGWDLFVAVFPQPGDAVRMFSRVSDPAVPAHDDALAAVYGRTVGDLYARIDALIGRVAKSLRPEDRLIVVGARGVRSVAREVSLSSWLVQSGYTVLAKKARASAREGFADVDWTRTRAFTAGAGDIYLNATGIGPGGIVEPGEASAALRSEIAGKLAGLEDKGKPVVREVVEGSALFPGSAGARMPDLVVVLAPGYGFGAESMKGAVPPVVIRDSLRLLTPAADGGAAVDVPGAWIGSVVPRGDPSVLDVAPTVLAFFGIQVPPGMPGKSLW